MIPFNELLLIFLFQSVSSKVHGQTLGPYSYYFLFRQQFTTHPSQIWRSDPSRGYTWLALSNDSTCSHQLDTHSAGENQLDIHSAGESIKGGEVLGMSRGFAVSLGFSNRQLVSYVNTGLNSNDWNDKCRKRVKSVATKRVSSWRHEMSSEFQAR